MIQENKLEQDKSKVFCDWDFEYLGTITDLELGTMPKEIKVIALGKEHKYFCNTKCAKAFSKKNRGKFK
jgi:hypothetical protein